MFFDIKCCGISGCIYWRPGMRCAKDGANLEKSMEAIKRIHQHDICEARRQIDIHRLTNLIEEG